MSKKWLDNAFWDNSGTKEIVNAILERELESGQVDRQVMKINKYTIGGEINPDFQNVIDSLGEELIDKNSSEREAKKLAEHEERKQREVEHSRARKLEELFNYKLEAFEVEMITNSTNRKLKSKLRRAQNKFEVDLFALMILQEEMNKEDQDGQD